MALRTEWKRRERVCLDADLANNSIVEVVSQTKGKLFTEVTSNGGKNTWSVMTYRLSKYEES